jgi:hypothetical protein
LLYGFEKQFSPLCTLLAAGLRRLELDEDAVRFFDVHSEVDVDHAEQLRAGSRPPASATSVGVGRPGPGFEPKKAAHQPVRRFGDFATGCYGSGALTAASASIKPKPSRIE